MGEESVSEALALAGPLHQSGDVGDVQECRHLSQRFSDLIETSRYMHISLIIKDPSLATNDFKNERDIRLLVVVVVVSSLLIKSYWADGGVLFSFFICRPYSFANDPHGSCSRKKVGCFWGRKPPEANCGLKNGIKIFFKINIHDMSFLGFFGDEFISTVF